MSAHLTPLEVAECLIAPIDELGAITNHHEKTPHKWRKSSAWRDAGDIPHKAARQILRHSQKNKLGLTAEHLLFGAPRREIAALLDARGQTLPRHLRERLPDEPVAAE